ncbi:MAG: nitrilase family protein [Bacteroidetes bacterium]|nr:nitrilase family protein [Bacteroidota bacterium]
MLSDITITLIQSTLHWEKREKNLDMFSGIIQAMQDPTDLIILPEMFSTGFTMNTKKCHEKMNGKTMEWMAAVAKGKKCAITGSLIVKEGKNFFNRLIWMKPDGKFDWYDKRHLFRMMEEDKHFAPGSEKLLVDLNGWKICPVICYDLRFPVWCRNRMISTSLKKKKGKNQKISRDKQAPEYDLLVVIANWPEIRRNAWRILLQARAIENQCYVAGVNRVGKDGNDISFSGNSEVVEPRGNTVISIKPYEEKSETAKLSWFELSQFREKFPAGLDADEFTLQ